MLKGLNEILKTAEEKNCAIGSFNTPNLESIRAVIEAAEELEQPVILMHAQIHEEMNLCKINEIGPIMLFMAERASVPVCVHLDHGTDIEYLKKGLEIGFNSVMYDGSMLSTEENCENTCIAVETAKKYNACVEAEVGSMGTREGGEEGKSIYTDPEAALDFVKKTGIDALACAFGTAHGMYLTEPKLDFERVSMIKSLVNIPMVMHGGSGVSTADYKEVIRRGIRKINYYTYMSKAGGEAISNKCYAQFHDAVTDAVSAMKADVSKAIKTFSML